MLKDFEKEWVEKGQVFWRAGENKQKEKARKRWGFIDSGKKVCSVIITHTLWKRELSSWILLQRILFIMNSFYSTFVLKALVKS